MAIPIWNEKENRWTLRIQRDGIVRKFTSVKNGAAGKRDVLRRAREWESGKPTEAVTVEKLWLLFLARIVDRRGKGESYSQNEMYGRLHVIPALGKRKIDKLTMDDWQAVISSAKPRGKQRADGTVYFQAERLSKKSLMNLRSAIMMFIKYAVERGYMDPLRGELYIPESAPTVGKDILQPEHIKRLFEQSDEWYADALRFEVVTGIRPGEVFGIKIDDYKDGHLQICRARNYRGKETKGKNKNAVREITLHSIAREIIERQIEKAKVKALETEYIFCNWIGEPGTQKGAYQAWRRLAAERCLPGTPYGLRHTFISMVKNDLPEQMIKAIVGHSASMDTFGVYGHEVDGEKEQAAKILDLTFARKLS